MTLHEIVSEALGLELTRAPGSSIIMLKRGGLVRPALDSEIMLWDALMAALDPDSRVWAEAKALADRRNAQNGSQEPTENGREGRSGPRVPPPGDREPPAQGVSRRSGR